MKKQLSTLLCAALLSLPGSTHLLASASPTPAKMALTSAARLQTPVELIIYIPYEGRDDYWDITLVENTTGESYHFETTSSNQVSHTLGTVSAGVYEVTFHAKSPFHTRFEYYAGCNDAIRIGYGDYTLFNREIDTSCNNIIIDAWQ